MNAMVIFNPFPLGIQLCWHTRACTHRTLTWQMFHAQHMVVLMQFQVTGQQVFNDYRYLEPIIEDYN